MPRTATNANGDVVIFNEQSGSWDPARTASNDKGEKVYYDGSAWQPLTVTAASSAREGAAPGGRVAAPAPAARPSPSPAGASFDPIAPLRAANQDQLRAAEHGQHTMSQGIHNLGAPFRNFGDPEAGAQFGLGMMQLPAGALEWLGAPTAPLFAGPSEGMRGTLGKGVENLTGSKFAGELAADTATTGAGALIFGAGGRGMPRPGEPLRMGDPRARGQIGPATMRDITPPQGPAPMPGGAGGLMERPIEGEIFSPLGMSEYLNDRRTGNDSASPSHPMPMNEQNFSRPANWDPGDRKYFDKKFSEFGPDQGFLLQQQLAGEGSPMLGPRLPFDAETTPEVMTNAGGLQPANGNNPFSIASPPYEQPNFFSAGMRPGANDQPPSIAPGPPQTGAGIFGDMPHPLNSPVDPVNGNTPPPQPFQVNGTRITPTSPPVGPPSQPPTGAAPPGGPAGPGQTPPAGGPPGATPAPYTPPPSALQLLRDGAKTVEKIISPTTVDANSRQAEADIREQIGMSRRDTEIARAALDDFSAQVRQMDGASRLSIIDYIEGRSSGAILTNPAWQPLADTMRNAFKEREQKLSNLPSTSQMAFVEDYFPHMWKDPRAAQQFASQWGMGHNGGPPMGKQGRGGFTKKRDIPTVADGLAAGLVPQTLNPIEAAMHYIANADRFIAINRVFDDARARGEIKYRYPGKQQAGEMEIHGRLGNKVDPNGVPMRAYAPEGWARVFNNFIDPGFTGPVGDVMNAAVRASNWVTGLELSLSGFHAVTMANEAMISSMARGLGEMRTGHPIEAGKAIAQSVVAPARTAMRGHALQQVYKGKRQGSPMQRQIADLIARAGGQAIKMDRAWLASRQGSYISAFKRGALKEELSHDLQDMRNRPSQIPAVAARHIARIMDTAMSWMFEHYIPKLKVGAFEEHMSAWLRRNPNAPPEVVLKAARDLWDSTDNRFGEMVRDNIFWRNTLKQSSQLALRSYSWTFGAGREIAGGVWDTGKAPFTGKWTPRMDYIIALPIMYGMWAAMYQFLKTGEPPKDEQDLLAPRTGGIDPQRGTPERVIPPGFMKDVFGWAHKGVFGELWAKTATLPRTMAELAMNKDWRGLPIAPGSHVDDPNAPSWLVSYFNHVLDNLGPFGVKNVLKGQKEGSNISGVESLLGFQAAGRQMSDPEGYGRQMKGIETKEWRRRMKADEREERRYKGPTD